MANLSEKLMKISAELKAPKNLENKFGGYKYRNVEGICEAVKPLLVKYGCVLTVSDEIMMIGDRFYIKATASLNDTAEGSHDVYTVSAYARETAERKGMDPAQVSGSASSYARKYALNGLFLLDDTKDPDTEEYSQAGTKSKAAAAKVETIGEDLAKEFEEDLKAHGIHTEVVLRLYNVKKLANMTMKQYANACENLDKIKAKQEAKG